MKTENMFLLKNRIVRDLDTYLLAYINSITQDEDREVMGEPGCLTDLRILQETRYNECLQLIKAKTDEKEMDYTNYVIISKRTYNTENNIKIPIRVRSFISDDKTAVLISARAYWDDIKI